MSVIRKDPTMSWGEVNSADSGGLPGVQRQGAYGNASTTTTGRTDHIVVRHHTRYFGRSYARKKTPDTICKITALYRNVFAQVESEPVSRRRGARIAERNERIVGEELKPSNL